MANTFTQLSREDIAKVYESHKKDHAQSYYKSLEKYQHELQKYVGAQSVFGKEGWGRIIDDDNLFNKAKSLSAEMFAGDKVLQGRFNRLMDNTRETVAAVDKGGFGMEGWGGGTAVYASSQGGFALGTTPFIIGGWLASARSEEIFQHIDNKNNMRLEFEYNIDYAQIGDQKFFFPQCFRAGEITGFNKLPQVDWVTPNTNTGLYTAPEPWCGEDMFILLNAADGSDTAGVKGNLLTVSGRNKMKYGIEPNYQLTAIKFQNGEGGEVITRRTELHYSIMIGQTNERDMKATYTLKDVAGFDEPIVLQIYMRVNIDNGDFILFVKAPTAKALKLIKGFKFDGRVSNEANEITDIPTMGVDKFQFIRECEYRNYSKVSLNEYMADNFRIGGNNNISYAAYATDKMLQYTIANRELEAEDFLIKQVLDDSVDIDTFELTRKMGGFIQNNLSFGISKFTPGLGLQDYKFGLKNYLNKVLAMADTDLNIPTSVKREWILMGYDAVVTEFPEVKFENAAVNLQEQAEGSAVNEHYGFAVDTKCGYIDSLGRSVRIIGNTDKRWQERGPSVYGALRTYSMEYPFLVYYPHAIRMFTAIDPDMPNRTAIILGGREFRGHFAAAAIKLTLEGVLDSSGMPVNNFDKQMDSSKVGYEFKTITE